MAYKEISRQGDKYADSSIWKKGAHRICDAGPSGRRQHDYDQDGSDAATFKVDFGRSIFLDPCTNEAQSHGDFDCDHDSDGTDAVLFKQDFGRSKYDNPCPTC